MILRCHLKGITLISRQIQIRITMKVFFTRMVGHILFYHHLVIGSVLYPDMVFVAYVATGKNPLYHTTV